jgi:hypothetical protein
MHQGWGKQLGGFGGMGVGVQGAGPIVLLQSRRICTTQQAGQLENSRPSRLGKGLLKKGVG